MENKIFLAKVKNTNDRDVVKYINFRGFECGHYFGGLNVHGTCFSGFEKELRDIVENNFNELETILTKNEFKKLFELNDEIKSLGYGIKINSDEYKKGLEIIDEYKNTIEKKLLSNDNDNLFEKIIIDEKEYLKNEYNLDDDEIKEIFDNYTLDYKDRSIISYIFKDFDDMVQEEKLNFGYEDCPYFDDESFGKDLLESESYHELDTGKIVVYNY